MDGLTSAALIGLIVIMFPGLLASLAASANSLVVMAIVFLILAGMANNREGGLINAILGHKKKPKKARAI